MEITRQLSCHSPWPPAGKVDGTGDNGECIVVVLPIYFKYITVLLILMYVCVSSVPPQLVAAIPSSMISHCHPILHNHHHPIPPWLLWSHPSTIDQCHLIPLQFVSAIPPLCCQFDIIPSLPDLSSSSPPSTIIATWPCLLPLPFAFAFCPCPLQLPSVLAFACHLIPLQ